MPNCWKFHAPPAPPPPKEAVSALKTFFAHYMILRVKWAMDYLDDNGLPTILQKEKVVVGGTDMAVSVAPACK